MKSTVSPENPENAKTQTASDPMTLLKRLKLAFLDDYKCERQGYDPYDTSRGRVPDVWSSKRKRA
jgi:hypothetical protein